MERRFIFMSRILLKHHYINATLKNGNNIDGDIVTITEDGFLIDDNITGDVMEIKNDEIEAINEYAE